jgi:hypothetical protein
MTSELFWNYFVCPIVAEFAQSNVASYNTNMLITQTHIRRMVLCIL